MMLKSSANNRCVTIVAAIVVLLVTLVLFSGVLSADFVMWDDDLDILGNRKITSDNIWWAFSDVDSMQRYNPLTFLAWSLVWHLAGFNPFWFHFGNWVLHGISTLFLYVILKNILAIGKEKGSFQDISPVMHEVAAVFGALLWGVHPLRVESVAWASCWTHCQAVFFLLGSLLCYLKAHGKNRHQQYVMYVALSIVAYICSLLSYPLGITFFVVFFLVDIFLLKRIEFGNSGLQWLKIKPVLVEKLFFAVPALLFGSLALIIRFRQSVNWSQPVSLSQFGLIERVMQAFYVCSYYLWKPFYPDGLAPIYTTLFSFDPFSPWFIVQALFIVGISALCLALRKRWPFLLGIWIAYLTLQLPFLGIFAHPHFTVDRYSLLSSLCFSVLAAILIARMSSSIRLWPVVFAVVSVIVVLSWRTGQQVTVWQNSETLFSHMIRVLGDDPYRVQIMGRLARYYSQSGQTDKSIETFNRLLAIKPTSLRAHSQLADVYCSAGKYEDALPHFRAMLTQQPKNVQYLYRYATALDKAGRHEEANAQLRFAESLQGHAVPAENSEAGEREL